MVGRPLDSEEVDLRAEREDEVVVGRRLQLAERHLARVEVDRGDLVLVDAHVVLLVEEVADRMADRRLLEETRRHLVEQRLEGVVVVLVDDHDVGVALLQLLGRADPGEAAAEHEHTEVGRFRRVWPRAQGTATRPAPRSSQRDEWSQAVGYVKTK